MVLLLVELMYNDTYNTILGIAHFLPILGDSQSFRHEWYRFEEAFYANLETATFGQLTKCCENKKHPRFVNSIMCLCCCKAMCKNQSSKIVCQSIHYNRNKQDCFLYFDLKNKIFWC